MIPDWFPLCIIYVIIYGFLVCMTNNNTAHRSRVSVKGLIASSFFAAYTIPSPRIGPNFVIPNNVHAPYSLPCLLILDTIGPINVKEHKLMYD